MLDLIIAAALSQAASQAASQVAPGPEWRLAFRADGGEVFVDPASLRREGTMFDITVRSVFERVQPTGMKSAVTRHRYDCARQSVLVLNIHALDANGGTIRNGPPQGVLSLPRPAGGRSAHAAILTTYCPPRNVT